MWRRFANRLVYGRRATPYEVLSEFSSRMAGAYESEDLLPRMARILAEGTGARSAVVWLRLGAELRPEAAWPMDDRRTEAVALTGDGLPDLLATLALPVHHRGELLGALTLTKPAGERVTPAEEKLAGDLASGAGLVLRNVRLTEELLARLEELRSSRQRIVAAQDQERRRLERNIHDGAQQQLVALAVNVRLARQLGVKDPAKANNLLEQTEGEVTHALEDLRDLARGIYPPLLADRGLVAALAGQARRSAVPVLIQGNGIGRYPVDAEAAVYFCVLEALQNVAKYARASRATVVRVLDPACGSGNFLYLALQALKDLEREAILWGSLTLKTPMQFPQVGPQALKGIELNTYAAELARVVVWIGEIQWMLSNGFAYLRDPVLRPLDNIEQRDAILDLSDPEKPAEPTWPDADAIIGNPPFLGGKLLRSYLGNDYVDALFRVYSARVPAEADLVCYWHEKARAMVAEGRVKRVGLLATQGIRGGANRRVVERIKESGDLFLAWSDEPWTLDGAAVNISFLGYDDGSEESKFLDGHAVTTINPNLTAGLDLTRVRRLSANVGIAFMGDTKGGPFEIPASLAKELLRAPNPDGRANSDVVKPWVNGLDVTRRPRDMWIVDFGVARPEEDAALYEKPFEYVREHVQPARENNRRESYAKRWWLHVEPRPGMRAALAGRGRYLATPTLSKHRLFVWTDGETLPDHQLIVFAREDDYFFGILHSHVHELWALRLGTRLETRPRYTPTTTFETYPFPLPAPEQVEAVAEAARHLDTLRAGWLNPPGMPSAEFAGRTMTALYNQRPRWLGQAHERLDRAVHDAYGWTFPTDDEEILARLMELNLTRAAQRDGRS